MNKGKCKGLKKKSFWNIGDKIAHLERLIPSNNAMSHWEAHGSLPIYFIRGQVAVTAEQVTRYPPLLSHMPFKGTRIYTHDTTKPDHSELHQIIGDLPKINELWGVRTQKGTPPISSHPPFLLPAEGLQPNGNAKQEHTHKKMRGKCQSRCAAAAAASNSSKLNWHCHPQWAKLAVLQDHLVRKCNTTQCNAIKCGCHFLMRGGAFLLCSSMIDGFHWTSDLECQERGVLLFFCPVYYIIGPFGFGGLPACWQIWAPLSWDRPSFSNLSNANIAIHTALYLHNVPPSYQDNYCLILFSMITLF